jgi:hypothetical protein
MASLTKYDSFKSMKQNSTAKVVKTDDAKKIAVAEISTFLQMLSKAKAEKGLKANAKDPNQFCFYYETT